MGDFKPDYVIKVPGQSEGMKCSLIALSAQITEKKDCTSESLGRTTKETVQTLATLGCCGPARKSACGVAPAETTQSGDDSDNTPCSKTDGSVVPWEVTSTFVYAICKCGEASCSQGSTCNVAKKECGCTPR